MSVFVYVELLKVISLSNNNERQLENSLVLWGNHDFIKIYKLNCNDLNDEGRRPFLWLKKQYEKNHSKQYDGLEHQPLYIFTEQNDEMPVLNRLIDLQQTRKKSSSIFLLSLFQLDYVKSGEDDLKNCLLKDIFKKINDEINRTSSQLNKHKLACDVFFNLGESDFALFFESDSIEVIENTLTELRHCIPIVKSYSLIILPYRYNSMRVIDKKTRVKYKKQFSKWLTDHNGKKYHLMTHFVVDNTYNGVLDIIDNNDTNINTVNAIYGDYDIELISNSDFLIDKDLSFVNPNTNYRYSKTTPLLPLDSSPRLYPIGDKNNNDKYEKVLSLIESSFNKAIDKIDRLEFPQKYSVKEDLLSAKLSFMGLANYFSSLHETRYAPDVYINIRPIFIELTEMLQSFSRYIQFNKNSDRDSKALDLQLHLKRLIGNLQQFLGIVSLSPRSFSEAHGSYMRSANAALKLICAYHTAVYNMHNATKIKINHKKERQFNGEYERNNCAVLILPSRDSEAKNITLFTGLSPEHHISIIEANFTTLFDVKQMLFQLAHEVGHFSGDRKREDRKGLFIQASIQYMLFNNIFNDFLERPYYFISQGIYDEDVDIDVKYYREHIESLDFHPSDAMTESLNNCIDTICSISCYLSNKLQEKKKCNKKTATYLSTFQFDMCYMKAIIEEYSRLFSMSEMLYDDDFNDLIMNLSNDVISVYNCAEKHISIKAEVSKSFKWKLLARLMKENTSENHNNKFIQLFSELTSDMLNESMCQIGEVFEDVFSDIYAIKILNIGADEYAKNIFANPSEISFYESPMFAMRFYTVMNSFYDYSINRISEVLQRMLPKPWFDLVNAQFYRISKYSVIFVELLKSYVDIFNNDEWIDYSKVITVRDFYNQPDLNLYRLWRDGLLRN